MAESTNDLPPVTYHDSTEFPFEELRDANGDMFVTAAEAMEFWDCDESNVWSIVETDREDTWLFGPAHHFINRLGYIVTKEAHDKNTYYLEVI